MDKNSLNLQPWPYRDPDALEALYEHVDQSFCLVQLPLPLPEAATRNYRRGVALQRINGSMFLCYAVCLEDQIIGKIDVTQKKNSAEIDLVIHEAYTSRGYGRGALNLLMDQVRERMSCQYLCAYVDERNLAMIHVLEHCGFVRTRAFSADVQIPQNGSYVLRTARGFEYIVDLLRS